MSGFTVTAAKRAAIAAGLAAVTATAIGAAATTSASPASAASSSATSADPGTTAGSAKAARHPKAKAARHAISTVTAVGPSSLTVKSREGTTKTWTIASDTKIVGGHGITLTLADLRVGDIVLVRPTEKGSTTAKAVHVKLAAMGGTVTAINGDAVTIRSPQGFNRVINLLPTTTYASKGQPATRDLVAVGAKLRAQGRANADATTLDAIKVEVAPAASATPTAATPSA